MLFLITLSVTVLGLGAEFAQLALMLYGVPALVFSFISIWYKNSEKHLAYQKFRTVVLVIFYCLIIIISTGFIVRQTYYGLRTSGVTGISKDQAIIKAKEKMVELSQVENNPNMNNSECSITDEPASTGGIYRVFCTYSDKNPAGGYLYLNVNSKDGSVSE